MKESTRTTTFMDKAPLHGLMVIYTGSFKDNKAYRQGVEVWPDGGRYIGTWIEGRKHGELTYSKGGTSREEIWTEGVLTSS
jgi:hypothetical protein